MPNLERITHRNPAAEVGSPVDPGTAVEEGSPAAGEDLAGMLPAAGHTGHYLKEAKTDNVNNMWRTSAQKAGRR